MTLKAIVSQRLVKKPDGMRIPAVEVMLNSRYIGELIDKGDLNGIKEAMEQSMSPGSQTFEQSLYALYKAGTITIDEALGNADSANNLHWLINNAATEKKADDKPRPPVANPEGSNTSTEGGASFSEFTLRMD